jgi:murein DD-endopeptidase MepM/ murein hydrolase activator NlpD
MFKTIFIMLLFFIPVLSSASEPINSPQIEISPPDIKQGDVFSVKINGTDINADPKALFNGRDLLFAKCGDGCFAAIGAAPLDAKPGSYRIEIVAGEQRFKTELVIKQARLETIKLTLPEGKVILSPEDAKRAEQEAERLKTIWEIRTERLWDGGFIMPLDNELSTPFGVKRIINNKKVSIHWGLDIRGKEGEPVKASNKGKAVLVEELFFGGKTVVIDHGLGVYTIYMHMSAFNIKAGDAVSKGDIIGLVGSTGRSSGPHLHFGIKVQNISANPASIVGLDL